MMLVVPLSSCITDDFGFSNNSGTLSGTDPEKPDSPFTPGDYEIVYHYDNGNTESFSKSYSGTFAYAARLPDDPGTAWTAPEGKVFAGWSTKPPADPSNPTTDPAAGEETSTQIDYLVYDDIKYDKTTKMPEGASGGVLNLYAVWTDAASNGKLNTVYLSQDGSGDKSGKDRSNAVAFVKSGTAGFSNAYAKLDLNGTTTTNRIIVVGKLSVSASNYDEERLWDGTNNIEATISGTGADSQLHINGSDPGIILKADTIFENIKFTNETGKHIFIYCYGNNLTMGENVDTTKVSSLSNNSNYAIPDGYPAFTILGGRHGGSGRTPSDTISVNSLDPATDTGENDVEIKLISGKYGRVSGFGRSYEPGKDDFYKNNIESLCPTITVCGTADIGTLAAGHLDSNCITGFKDGSLKIANIIVRDNANIVNLVGGNVGNSAKSTFVGNVIISIFNGTIKNVYGAGLGRVQSAPSVVPQTSMSGCVTIYLCGGEITENLYGGGAAAALSSAYAAGIKESLRSIDSKTEIIISAGTVKGNVYGGGYGQSDYMNGHYSKGDKYASAGTVAGSTHVAVLGGTIGTSGDQASGNIYGGGKGATHTNDSASVTGNTNVHIFGGQLGSVYGGGEGIDNYPDIAKVSGSTSVYVKSGNVSGNVYGGGSIAVVTNNPETNDAVEGSTSVTIAGGTIGGKDGGKVFGGGEGTPASEWAGKVSGSTSVTISNGIILGSVYGGGNYGVVGTEGITGSSTTINISGSDIAGSVYGGGRGSESDISDGYQPGGPEGTILNEVERGNVYGDTSVTVSGGKIGYLNSEISNGIWYDSEDSGSVYGGGKLGLVVGTTEVKVSGGDIHRNVYGGGKGLSKSVFIEKSDNSITASLYNMIQILSSDDEKLIKSELWANPSFVSKYVWEGSDNPSSGFEKISALEDISTSPEGHSISTIDVTGYNYIRLTVEVENEVTGTESISSNVINVSGSDNLTKDSWMVENRKLVQFGAVTEGTDVTISGTAKIHTNVYGGGSYAAVGKITGRNLNISPAADAGTDSGTDTYYTLEHKISGGTTSVTINGGQIGGVDTDAEAKTDTTHTHSKGGNVFGGGMGEPDNVTTGSVGKSASVSITNGTICGNVFGGGENGFVGGITILISPTMYQMPLDSNHNLITYTYRLQLSDPVGNSEIGVTSVTVSGGTVGYEKALNNMDRGNVFGAGKGVNATVTGTSSVTIGGATSSGPTVNGNVFGGGDLGPVGLLKGTAGKDLSLTGGKANVTIKSGEINGSVFGGGKGQSASVSAEALILGTVQHTNVEITGGSINRINDAENPRGNVYGGGELGLVGALNELAEKDASGNLKFNFNEGTTSVTISGNTKIAGNVYGGGKGDNGIASHPEAPLTTIILGSVASSTEVNISGSVSIGTVISNVLEDGTGNVYGGGELGIVGTYSDEGDNRIYHGGSSTTIISGGTIYNEVYGGGEGTPKNVLSGAVGNATTIISGTTTIKGSVYGGGAYSIVGGTSVTIDRTPTSDGTGKERIDPKITAAANDAKVNIVILGGKIYSESYSDSAGFGPLTSSVGNVFGGGYGPKATVAGSTYVFIGKPQVADVDPLHNLIKDLSQSEITIFGNIFGGGDMGSIGFDRNTSQVNTSDFGKDYGIIKPSNISSNVSITTSGTDIEIGIENNSKTGNIYAGGRGGDLKLDLDTTLKGYAIVHGNSNLTIHRTGHGNITIYGGIYGAGQGVPEVTEPGNIDVILYAAVTGNTSISISNANVNNVYGGGQLSILGWYYDDDNPTMHSDFDVYANESKYYRHYTGTDTKIIINNSNVSGSVYGGGMGTTANAISGAVGESTVIIGGGSTVSGDVYGGGNYAVVSNKLVVDRTPTTDENGKTVIYPKLASSDNTSKAVVVILDATIGSVSKSDTGNVFGGGYGPRAVVAGSTYVFIGVSSSDNYPKTLTTNLESKYNADIKGSIFGGGNMGSVGFIEHLEGSDNEESFPSDYATILSKLSVSSNVILNLNGNSNNKITVGEHVYGGGKGGDLYIPNPPTGASFLDTPPTTTKPDNWVEGESGRTLYGYAVVHGSSKVSITGVYAPAKTGVFINITGNVFGGGEGILASEGQNSLDVIVYAAVTDASSVTISNAHISGDIYGGGNLGVVGYFIDSEVNEDSKIVRDFTGEDSHVTINASLIEGTVFGGGSGTTTNILSGAVGNTNVVIMGEETVPGGREIAAASTIRGSVYGGGAYALVGSMGIEITVKDGKKENPTVTECSNSSTTNVIILNSIIETNSKKNDYGGAGNVFGGGYGPRAVIAGSTNVYIGSEAVKEGTSSPASSVTISGSVFGGGNMGSIGVIPGVFSFKAVDDYSKVNSELEDYNKGINDDGTGNKKITADVKVVINNNSDTINIKGSVYGGGKGGDLTVGPNGEKVDLKGYAVIYGTTDVYIHGDSSDSKSNLTIGENVYGGGLGETKGVHSIQYAEIYDSATVSVTYAEIGGSVYGGGEFGIIGHFVDGTAKEVTANEVNTLSDGNHVWVLERDFCGDAIYYDGNIPKLNKDGNAYKGKASAAVTIEGSAVGGNVFGGGKGKGTEGNVTSGNILSGAVGRETSVTINSGEIKGNVYGGGEFGIVGSTTTQLMMITKGDENPFTGSNVSTTIAASVIVNIPHLNLTESSKIETNLDIQNDVCTHVNINGGTISGSVFGAGKGETLNPLHVWTDKGINNAEYALVEHNTAYNKLSVIGRTEVNISNGTIHKHVYGGSENGDMGGFSTLKHLMQYLCDTNENDHQTPIDLKDLASLDAEIRDKNEYKVGNETKKILNYQFSAAFVNIVGGTIYGNVFGGGYFGAIYGNTHVHIGWNSVMPYDDKSNGDCHYYNDYGPEDGNFANKPHPFEDNKDKYVHDLFINGTVFAGGDRGDPYDTVNYDYISVYGTSHIFVNGTGYATGTNIPITNDGATTHAMYIQGSLFGSGNSCSTFYVDRDMSRFITITNYNAINDKNQYIIYSIQRATNVTLINSSLRLPGRSDGSNLDKTALYSLNHVINLTLQSGSEIILDSVVQDLRSIYSRDGTGADTQQGSALNTIKLNNGITLIIKTEKNTSVTSPNPALSGEADWPDGKFGKVTGYFFLDLSDASYYTAYVYGSLESQGGFTYGNSFGSLSGTKVPFEDFGTAPEGYRAWHPVGGGHLAASSTIVADTTEKGGSNEYVNYGKIVLPMTEAGAKFKLIGYNIYPAQAASLNDDKASLRLIGENVSFGDSDVNRYFKLKASLGAGFDQNETGASGIWITDAKDTNLPGTEFTAEGGVTLPEINLELRSNGVTQTTTAGYVVLLIQELIPDGVDDENNPMYTPGNEISAVVNIETQAEGFGTPNHPDGSDYINNMNLYATKEGEDSWNMSISNIDDSKYRFELTSVSATDGINLVDNVGSIKNNNQYVIRMNHSLNNDNSTGWDGFSFKEFALTNSISGKLLGETDGRFNTSFQFTINNLKDSADYKEGTVTLTISYYNLSKTVNASEEPVLSASTSPDGTIQIVINVGELKPWYNVKFVPYPEGTDAGVGAVATQQITYNTAAVKPTPDPSMQNNQYTFEGWYRSYSDNGKYLGRYSFDSTDSTAFITADTTLYGKWVSAVTFDYNYDNSPASTTVRLSDKTGTVSDKMPLDPVRTGYTFKGWNTKSDGTGDKFESSTSVEKNTTVYAVWEPLKYTIEFNTNNPGGVTDSVADVSSMPNVSDPVTLPDPNPKELNSSDSSYKYEFVGWATSSDAVTGYTGSTPLSSLIGENNVSVTGDNATITLYAVWKKSTLHTVTLTTDPLAAGKYVTFEYCLDETISDKSTWIKANAFNVTADDTVHIRYSISSPGDAGYSVGGYLVDNVSQSTANSVLTLSKVESDTAVTLNLIAKQIEVKLDLGGGALASSATTPINVTFGEKYSALTDPTKLGYEFTGWYTAQSNGTKVTSDTEVTNPQPHTLYALWGSIDYYIIMHGANSDVKSQSFNNYTNNKVVKLIPNDFKNGNQIFKGWATESNGSVVTYIDNQSIAISDDWITNAKSVTVSGTEIKNVVLELYAVWESPELTITFTEADKEVSSAIFDGSNWKDNIGIGNDAKIKINAKIGGDVFDLLSSDKITWKENGTEVSPDRMKHKGIFDLELTCIRTDGDNSVTYHGKASFEILPYTGSLGVILSPDYTYSGQQPNILDGIIIYIDNGGKTGEYDVDVDYALSQNEINNFTKLYSKLDGTTLTGMPIDAGSYTLTLTATSEATDFYSSDNSKASGSAKFEIAPYTDNIFIVVKDNMIYAGSDADQNPVVKVYLGDNADGFEIKDWESLFDISYKKKDGTDLGSEQPTDAGNYTVTLTAKSSASNYYDSSTSNRATGTKDYEIEKLPITITPNKNQWKYYGDPIWSESNSTIHIDESTFNNVQYTISATIGGMYVPNFTPGKDSWSTYSGIIGDLAVTNLEQFSDYGSYDYGFGTITAANNSNYKITPNTENGSIQFNIEKLPIFIVPLADQWKYYGYDLTGGSISGIHIGGNIDKSYKTLQYDVYRYVGQNPVKIDNFFTADYAKLTGSLTSNMLNAGTTVGHYAIDIGSINNDNNQNYEINYYQGSQAGSMMALGADPNSLPSQSNAEVKKRPLTVTWTKNAFTYDGTDQISKLIPELAYEDQQGALDLELIAGDLSLLLNDNPADKFLLAGAYTVNINTSSDKFNEYSFETADTTKSISMNKADLTISFKDLSKEYTGKDKFTFAGEDISKFTFTGLKDDGSISDAVTEVVLTTSSANVGIYQNSTDNEITITISVIHGSDVSDIRTDCYNLKILDISTFIINQKQLIIEIKNKSKPYDGELWSYDSSALNSLLNDKLVDGDNITNNSSIKTNLADAGIYSHTGTEPNPFTIALNTTNGLDNYNVSYDLSVEINKKEITLDISDNRNKVYDGTTNANISASINANELIGEDKVDIKSSSKYDTPHVGTGKTITLTINLGGDHANNYTLGSSYTPGENNTFTIEYADGVITAKSLVISLGNGITQTYNGSVWEYDLAKDSNGNITISDLANNDKLESGTIKTSGLKAGTYNNTDGKSQLIHSLQIKNNSNEDVINNYSISITGSVEITKKDLSIIINASVGYRNSTSFEFTSFDDTSGFNITNDDLISGDRVTKITITLDSSKAGKYKLTIDSVKAEIENNSDDCSDCYKLIISENSTLNIFGKITYHLNGGLYNNNAADVTVYVDITTDADTISVSKSNFEFGGWYKESGFSGSKVEKINSDVFGDKSEIDLYAEWLSKATITILLDGNDPDSNIWKEFKGQVCLYQGDDNKYDLKGSNGIYTKNVTPGNYDIYVSYPADNDLKKAGTIDLENGKGSANVIFYTVSFDGNGHTFTTSIPEQHILSEYTATSPNTPATSDDFSFAGWFSDKDCKSSFNFEDPITEKTVIYAGWAENKYSVTIELNKDDIAWAGQEVKLVNADDENNIHILTYNGGVYSSSVAAGTYSIFCNGKDTNKSVTVSAENPSVSQEINYYTVSFNLGAHSTGSAPDDQIVLENDYVTPVKDPEPDGDYNFTGWFDGEDKWLFNDALNPSKVTSKTTLTAQWKLNTYNVDVTIRLDNTAWNGLTVSLVVDDDMTYPLSETNSNGVHSSSGIPSGTYTIKFTYGGVLYTNTLSVSASDTNAATLTYWTVTFDYTYDNISTKNIVLDGNTLTEPEDVTREHYDFKGWFTDKEWSDDKKWDFKTPVKATQTLYAKWEAKKYTITFDSNGGSEVKSITAAYGALISKPTPDPTKTGYTFTGWFKESDFQNEWAFETNKVTSDTTLYAKWGLDLYSIKYFDGSREITDLTPKEYNVNSGYITLPTSATKTGYTFAGWYDNADLSGNTVTLIPAQSTGNKEFYAKWTPITYSVVFNANGGEGNMENQSFTYDAAQNLITNSFTKTGYKFLGWSLDEDATEAKYADQASVSNLASENGSTVTLYAVWQINQYTITFNSNGGSAVASTTQNYGTAVEKPTPDPTREGYTFTGWYTDDGTFSNEYSFTTMPAENITLYAKWTKTSYSITYPQNPTGGSVKGANTAVLDETVTVTVTSSSGYNLKEDSLTAKYKNSDGIEQSLTLTSGEGGKYTFEMPAADVTISAEFEQIEYKITLDDADSNVTGYTYKIGSGSETIYTGTFTLKYSQTVVVTPTLNTGYKVSSWEVSGETKDASEKYTIDGSKISADTTVKAVTSEIEYKIKYDGNGNTSGTAPTDDNSYNLNDEVTLKDHGSLIRMEYEFIGWTYTSDATEALNSPITLNESTITSYINKDGKTDNTLTLYAVWTPDSPNPDQSYKVEFDSNGGSTVPAIENVASGSKITKPADPTKSGYEFKGWYKDAALTAPWDFDNDVVTENITLYAKWEPKDEPTPTIYKVEYNANGGEGEVPKAELHFAGEFVTVKSADLRKNGYTFKGWCDSVTQTTYQPDEKFRMPSRDVCLTAVWESDPISGKEVSVTFIVDNEIYGISSTHIHTALNGAMQPDPIKEGFDFIGWYTKEGEVFTANTIVNNDMTVYAKFELNEDYVLVTYIIDNEVYMTLACKKTKIIEPNILAGIGKELNGWYTDKELKNKFDFNSVINEDSLTLYAEWKNNSNFMILFIFALFAGFMAAVVASTKRISFYENKNDEEKYASVIMIGKGTLKDRLPSHSGSNFEGWYSESGELITEDTEITQSMKVYAHWKH